MPWKRLLSTEGVVHGEAGRHIRPFPYAVLQRVQEGHRMYEVRGEAGEHEFALVQRLSHQSEVTLLEVAESTVEELA